MNNFQDPMDAFMEEARIKHEKGIEEHRGGDPTRQFAGHLPTEYEQEQTDSFNYLCEMLDTGLINEDEFRHATKLHMECWFWMRANVRGR